MSIASRITAMEGHISNAYDGLEDLGVDLTNVDKNIDNIASKLEEVWQGYPKVSESDETEATLNETKAGRMEIDLKGNTEQTQYNGYNLCYNAQISQSVEINFQFIRKYIEKTFTISFITNETLAGNSVYLDKGQGGSVYISSISGSANTRISTTITLADEVFEDLLNSSWYKIRVYKSNGNFQLVENAQIENGTNLKSYEPYCGGIPSPNPSYPEQIKNVTGDANVKIQKGFKFEQGGLGDGTGEEGVNNARIRTDFIEIKESMLITYNLVTEELDLKIRGFYYYDSNKSFISAYVNSNGMNYPLSPISLQNCKYVRVVAQKSNYTQSITPNDKYLVLSEYEQNYPFTFAEGQRAMQGTTLQDDGIHNKRKQVVFDGSNDEGWNLKNAGVVQFNIAIPNIASIAGLCDKMFCKVNYQEDGKPYMRMNSGAIWLDLGSEILEEATVENLRTWLSTNNLTVEYELVEPEIIPYNSTQQSQYNAIKKAQSYDDQTNISQTNDELPFILDIEALKNN